MSEWMVWVAAAGVMLILEMLTGTFYLLMIAFGMAAGAIASVAGAASPIPLFVAAATGIIATYALRNSRLGHVRARIDAGRDPSVLLDIGQELDVKQWHRQADGNYTARVMYRGALWDVRLDDIDKGQGAGAGIHIIREVRGSQLIVARRHDQVF